MSELSSFARKKQPRRKVLQESLHTQDEVPKLQENKPFGKHPQLEKFCAQSSRLKDEGLGKYKQTPKTEASSDIFDSSLNSKCQIHVRSRTGNWLVTRTEGVIQSSLLQKATSQQYHSISEKIHPQKICPLYSVRSSQQLRESGYRQLLQNKQKLRSVLEPRCVKFSAKICKASQPNSPVSTGTTPQMLQIPSSICMNPQEEQTGMKTESESGLQQKYQKIRGEVGFSKMIICEKLNVAESRCSQLKFQRCCQNLLKAKSKSKLLSKQLQALRDNKKEGDQLQKKIVKMQNELAQRADRLSESQKTIGNLKKLLTFEQNSYMILLNHYNNSEHMLSKQIQSLEQSGVLLSDQNADLLEHLSQLKATVQKLKRSSEDKDSQIQQLSRTLIQQRQFYEQQSTPVVSQINECDKCIQECQLTYGQQQQRIKHCCSNQEQEVRNMKILVISLRKRVHDLEKYIKMESSPAGEQDPGLKQYTWELFTKSQRASDKILNLQIKLMELQNQLRTKQKSMQHFKAMARSADTEVEYLKSKIRDSEAKVKQLSDLLQMVNFNTIQQQLSFQNNKLQAEDHIQSLMKDRSYIKSQLSAVCEEWTEFEGTCTTKSSLEDPNRGSEEMANQYTADQDNCWRRLAIVGAMNNLFTQGSRTG